MNRLIQAIRADWHRMLAWAFAAWLVLDAVRMAADWYVNGDVPNYTSVGIWAFAVVVVVSALAKWNGSRKALVVYGMAAVAAFMLGIMGLQAGEHWILVAFAFSVAVIGMAVVFVQAWAQDDSDSTGVEIERLHAGTEALLEKAVPLAADNQRRWREFQEMLDKMSPGWRER